MSTAQFAPLPSLPVTREALLAWLAASGINAPTIEHPPLFTVEESQALRGRIEGGHTKNLFLKDKKSNYFLLTAQEDTEIDLKSVHRLLGGSGRVSFGKADALQDMLGVKPGAVTALGVINDWQGRVTFAIDQRLMSHDIINCHPLANDATTSITRKDLLAIARVTDHDPLILDLAQPG